MRPASTVWYGWRAPSQPSPLTIDGCQGATYHMKLAVYRKLADPVPPFSNLEDHGAVGEDQELQEERRRDHRQEEEKKCKK
jgi:hypothetical protein